MPVTSTRRISTSSTTGLPPFSGSTLSTSTYRRSTALSPSRFLTTSSSNSTSGLGVGYYRSLSSSSNYLSNRNSVAGYPSNESSYVGSRYSTSKSTASTSGDSGLGERTRGSGLLGSRASIARSVALSGADLYAKYSPANYVPNSDLSRSRSLTDANRDRQQSHINNSTTTTNSSSSYSPFCSSSSSSYSSAGRNAKAVAAAAASGGSSDVGGSSKRLSCVLSSNGRSGGSSTSNTNRSPSSSIANRRSLVYSSQDDDEEAAAADENNNNNSSSRSGRSSLRRKGVPPKVALGGAGSALDTVDSTGDIKVTASRVADESADNIALLSCDETNNNQNKRHSNPCAIGSASPSLINPNNKHPAAANNHTGTSGGKRGQSPSNVTKITINHSAANGTSVILNNTSQYCTSNNRAIVHIFGTEERNLTSGSRGSHNKNNTSSNKVNHSINNNYNNNNNGKVVSLRPVVGATEKTTVIKSELNGDIRRTSQREANGTRVIQVGGGEEKEIHRQQKKEPAGANGIMLLRQGGLTNGTTATVARSVSSVNGKVKRDPEIFLRDECDLVRNELMQKKIAEHNPIEERLNGGGVAVNGKSPTPPVSSLSEETSNPFNKFRAVRTDANTVISSSGSGSGVKTITVKTLGGRSASPATRSAEINNNPGSTNLRERMENAGWRTELEERRGMVLQNGHGGYRNGGMSNGTGGRGSSPMDVDSSEEHSNGGVGGVAQRDYNRSNGKKTGSNSSHSSNSSSASSLMDSSRSNFEDIKFIDSDDNNEPAALGAAALNGISKLNKSLASTLDSLKASTPIVGSSRQYNVMNGHHTLPYHGSSGMGSASGVNGRLSSADYSKKYSTLSNLPSKSSVIRNGLSNGGLFGEERKSFVSNDARIMGLVPPEDDRSNGSDGVKEHELLIEETSEMDPMVTSSEPPNDKISGKSWEVNGTNGSGVRTSSLRNALPPVSPVRTWERDRPRYRELLDAEPSTTSSSLSSKYDSYDKGSSDTVEGLCGLRNIGNTCFMNSVIQCLSHTNDLTKFLRAQRDPKSTTKDQRIFSEYVKLIKDMWSPSTRTVTPMELKSAVSSKHRMYSGCGQQDAQEFLRFFLEALHGACNEGTKQEGLTLDDNLSDGKRADLMWDWYSKTESSVIKDLFVGQLRSTLRCTVCGNTSVTFDPFWDLSVPLPPSSSRCKLENCLELFIREEVLDGDEMPTCSKCKTRRKSTKSFTIQRFPKYLVIHLKRFSETRWSKLTNVVEFPMGERELNLAPYASNNTAGSPHYSLYGISNHMGSTAGGHYVALCKHPQTRKWHEFNDNHVSDSSESSLISSSAYLLFYERA